MKKIDAIIYDVDGTLLDTREWILGAFEHTAKHFGYMPTPREIIIPMVGQSLGSMYEVVCPNHQLEELRQIHKNHQTERIESVKAYPGIDDVLKAHTDIKQAIVTSRVDNIEKSLEQNGLLDYFDTLVSSNHVEFHKPHPQGINIALAELSVEPENAVYVGDAKVDMEAAKRAHVTAIGVTWGFGVKKDLELYGADHVADNAKQLIEILSSFEN